MSKENLEKEIAKGNVSTIAFYNLDGNNMLYTQKYVEQKEEEIQRLNNIIEELEKWLQETQELTCICETTINYINAYENVLKKLKELKEGK